MSTTNASTAAAGVNLLGDLQREISEEESKESTSNAKPEAPAN